MGIYSIFYWILQHILWVLQNILWDSIANSTKETFTQCYYKVQNLMNKCYIFIQQKTLIVHHSLQSLFKTWKNKKVHSPCGYSLTRGDLTLTNSWSTRVNIKKFSCAILSQFFHILSSMQITILNSIYSSLSCYHSFQVISITQLKIYPQKSDPIPAQYSSLQQSTVNTLGSTVWIQYLRP